MLTMHKPITRDRENHTAQACARGFDAALDDHDHAFEGVGHMAASNTRSANNFV